MAARIHDVDSILAACASHSRSPPVAPRQTSSGVVHAKVQLAISTAPPGAIRLHHLGPQQGQVVRLVGSLRHRLLASEDAGRRAVA